MFTCCQCRRVISTYFFEREGGEDILNLMDEIIFFLVQDVNILCRPPDGIGKDNDKFINESIELILIISEFIFGTWFIELSVCFK